MKEGTGVATGRGAEVVVRRWVLGTSGGGPGDLCSVNRGFGEVKKTEEGGSYQRSRALRWSMDSALLA